MSIRQKNVLQKVVKNAGIKISSSWNDDNKSKSVSIKTTIPTKYDEGNKATQKDEDNFIEKCNEFILK